MNTPIRTSDTPASHASPQRILSIDIMRGLTLFLMLFVNDVFMPGVPKWIGHTEADVDGMGLADWVLIQLSSPRPLQNSQAVPPVCGMSDYPDTRIGVPGNSILIPNFVI